MIDIDTILLLIIAICQVWPMLQSRQIKSGLRGIVASLKSYVGGKK